MFISFEGPEGGGKTTQLERLRHYLLAKGIDPLCLREPGATMVGERVRGLLLDENVEDLSSRAEALLYCAARAQLVCQVLQPGLAAGRTVLCDRYSDSTMAYQGYGRGLPLAELAAVNRFATGGLVPDLTICLDLPVELGIGRKHADNQTNRIEADSIAFHERVRRGFLELAAAEPQRWRVVDATQSPDRVWGEIRRHVDAILEGD